MMRCLLATTSAELRGELAAAGVEPYRARQLLRWIYARGVRDFDRMTDLGRALRAWLEAGWSARALEEVEAPLAADGTRKLVLRAGDGSLVEAVIIPEERRRTVCVSSQVGCSLDCSFCATGALGFGRNLRAGEIVDQVIHAQEWLARAGERVTHVVFMGMGEPLLNLPEVAQAIRVLRDPDGLGLGPRRITVSTAGVVPRMAALAGIGPVRLAVSLHATTDLVRDRLVPLNRRFPLAELLEACRAHPAGRRDPISFEYTLIAGVNDSVEDAERLGQMVQGMRAKVNLIALNEHPATHHRRPDDAVVDRFAGTLARAGVRVSVRRSRGGDILAACGQLGARAPERAPAASPAAPPVR
jgi:23S rRNA (adenine2503-C2)-methyltransferase